MEKSFKQVISMSNLLNILGVEYSVIFDNDTIYHSFFDQSKKYRFVNAATALNNRRIALRFTDNMDYFYIMLSKGKFEYATDYTFNNDRLYLFRIKDFSVLLDTHNDSLVVYAPTATLKKYCFDITIHLHFKIFYQLKSIMFHAGVVYNSKAVLLFFGESNSGKSTTCARCVLEGMNYFTDENLIVTRDEDKVVLTTLEPRLAIRKDAVQLFPCLKSFKFKEYNDRMFVEEYENNLVGACLDIESKNKLVALLVSSSEKADTTRALLSLTIRRTNGSYLLREYCINQFDLITNIKESALFWHPPVDKRKFSSDIIRFVLSHTKNSV